MDNVMMSTFETENEFGKGTVRNWASILDATTRAQAEMISRSPAVSAPVALMPDAHFGLGACVGSAIVTSDSILPSAVGVDIGCGVIAVETTAQREQVTGDQERRVLGKIRDTIPAGVGQGHGGTTTDWATFKAQHGEAPTGDDVVRKRASEQFGTLGAGNHFAEVCEDKDSRVWLLVHSGSRGPGNMLAVKHIAVARARSDIKTEHADLAWLSQGSPAFDAYVADMKWAQAFAFSQRQSMMDRMVEALASEAKFEVVRTINCHHNYSLELGPGKWLSRKGAIAAEAGVLGIIPGSMGAQTYIVRGKGNVEAHCTSPHGAGRLLGRNQARKTLKVEDFKAQMAGRTWQDRDAEKLLDEAPGAYKPIDVIMKDAEPLVEPVAVMSQFINFKGL